jgi:eukaryotic-like serine/threonine-protein kinase
VNGDVLAGRYRLLAPLGRGGAGEVWRAEDFKLGRLVAVKLLSHRDGEPMGSLDRIQAEARAAAQLSHPNVVATYDVGTTSGQVYLVMELVAGRDLAQLLRSEGRPPPALVAGIAVQAARALDAAHGSGIVHCDVKPGNLLLAADGTLKITDFGIARAGGPDQAGGSMLLGTPAYVAPEQVRGLPATPASDQYALGCVLYELLTGAPPFSAGEVEDVLRQHVEAAPEPVQVRRPDAGAGLADLVMRLLAKDPSARPASAAEVVACLESADPAGTVSPERDDRTQVLATMPYTAPEPHGRAPRALPYLRIAGVATVLLAVLGGAALLRDATRGSSVADPGQASPTVTRTSTPRASATPRPARPTPTPTSTSSTPTASTGRPADATAALTTLAELLRQSQGRGSKVAREAARDLDRVSAELADGNVEKAVEKFGEARDRLAEAREEGRWRPTPQIAALLTQLTRQMQSGDGADE